MSLPVEHYQKAAAVLNALNQEEAVNLLRNLNKEDVERIFYWVENLEQIPVVIKRQAVPEFYGFVTQEEETRSKIAESLGQFDKTQPNSKSQPNEASSTPRSVLAVLKMAPSYQLANSMRKENPITVAFLLTFLDPRRAADIMGSFSSDQLLETALAMGKLATYDARTFENLTAEIVQPSDLPAARHEPDQFLFECVAQLPETTQQDLLDQIEQRDVTLFSRLSERLNANL